MRVAAAITLHRTRHTGPQLAHALRPHQYEGAACDLGEWRRWGEATPALGVLETLFCFLPRRCRPTLARVGLCREAPTRTRSSPSMGLKDAVRVGGVRGLTVQRCAIPCVQSCSVSVTVTFRGSNITGRAEPPSNAYPRPRPARVGRGTPTAPGPEATRVVHASKHTLGQMRVS